MIFLETGIPAENKLYVYTYVGVYLLMTDIHKQQVWDISLRSYISLCSHVHQFLTTSSFNQEISYGTMVISHELKSLEDHPYH